MPFVAADGTTYYGGANGGCGIAPEASNAPDPAAPPSNTTYATTGLDGKGQTSFVVWTNQQNASLGCSNTVPCALVVVPILGISCDGSVQDGENQPSAADVTACESLGSYAPGAPATSDGSSSGAGDPPVTGALWWSASNWKNHITVPLTFAPAADTCDVVGGPAPIDIYGSELMDEATVLWQTEFCTDPRLFPFQHIRTAEPLAKTALSMESIDAALISRPPDGGYVEPTVTAPVGITGFAISYVIDDANRRPYTSLKLNARLLAKLLSESYWALPALRNDYRALKSTDAYAKMATNPQDITTDPEFIALNPGIGETKQVVQSSTLLALASNSDVMYALTSYINADPDARAFLDGKPDPWGMVVNPTYKNIPLPTESWPLLDTFKSPDIDLGGCLRRPDQTIAAVPILPLIAAPTSSLTSIAQSMQYAIGSATTACSALTNTGGQIVGGSLKPIGREQPGSRFMLGLTAIDDSQLFGLNSAALQSSPGHFVAPSIASLKATMVAALAKMDAKTHTWPIPYAKLRTIAAAYPGTMVVYAAIPTTRLDPVTAAKLAVFLLYAAGPGQTPGDDIGELPPGFLPMTAANGLGALVTYTNQSALVVAAQGHHTSSGGSGGSGGGGGSSGGSGSGSGGGKTTTPRTPVPSASASPPYIPPVDLPVGYTAAVTSSTAAWAMPVAILISVVCTLIAIVVRTAAGMRSTSNMRNRLRRMNQTRQL